MVCFQTCGKISTLLSLLTVKFEFMEKAWVKNMVYAYWFVIVMLRMHPGLSVFLFQIVCIRHWKLRLKAELGWKTRTPSHEELLQFQNVVSFCVEMELQTSQNLFTKNNEMCNDKRALLGCNVYRCHCFPDSGTSRAGTWALHQPPLITGYSWPLLSSLWHGIYRPFQF